MTDLPDLNWIVRTLISENIRNGTTTQSQPGRVGKKAVSVYLDESAWRDLKIFAAENDTTIDALMRQGLDLVFEKHGVNRGAV